MNDGTHEYPRYGEGGRIFGLPLEDAVRISKISATTGVPAVVTRCIEYLDIMGIEEVGLYRVPGSTINVNRLKTIFDSGKDRDNRPPPSLGGCIMLWIWTQHISWNQLE